MNVTESELPDYLSLWLLMTFIQQSYSYSIILTHTQSSTYDHRVWKTGLPVRSAVLKPHAGELVVGWVTTSESSLLYVFIFLFLYYIHTPSAQ